VLTSHPLSAHNDTSGRPRRVVLATAVAESSLTVPGVRVVVDAGLARVPRVDLARGLGALATVRVSRSAAHQRAGRAGREAPGRAYRCWSEAEHGRLPAHPEPEIETSDLTGFALALARWGDPDGASLPLLDAPPAAAMSVARETLLALGAVEDDGRVSERGRVLATAGVHPRLARALLDGGRLVGRRRAAEVVAILSDDSLATGTDDLAQAWRRLRNGSDPAARRWRDETRRLSGVEGGVGGGSESGVNGGVKGGVKGPNHREGGKADERRRNVSDDLAAGIVAGLAYPERLARLRPGSTDSYLMTGGTGAQLSPGSGLTSVPWLAVAVAERQPGAPSARVRLAAAIDEATALEVGAALASNQDEVGWGERDVVARRVERLGAIVLSERPLARPDPVLVAGALREGLRREGFRLLPVGAAAEKLRSRMAFCRWALGPEWPDVTDAILLSDDPEHGLDRWIGPWLSGARSVAGLRRIDFTQAFRGLLDYRQAAVLDQVAPETVTLPDGKQGRLTYSDDRPDPGPPVLAVRLQAVLGWTATPVVGVDPRRPGGPGIPVVLHLLSPAGRPLAVTSDLESFWRNGYPEVRAQMRGRYPKHAWPEDPLGR
jgi:ATP-dependent helicase HrpB